MASGPVVGGAIAQGIDWEWIFWINVPIGALLIPFVVTKIRETRGPDAGLDVPGLVRAETQLLPHAGEPVARERGGEVFQHLRGGRDRLLRLRVDQR